MLKLYGFLYSPPSRACYTFLKMFEDVAPFEFVSVNAWEQENETEKFRNMNPLGKNVDLYPNKQSKKRYVI